METIQFSLTSDYIELFKLLKITGFFDSGGAAKYAVSQGLIKVDGKIETRKACKIRTGQRVEVDGTIISVG